jgi:hypothetical protein
VGGLPESIVDGETGVLAHTPEELVERVRALIADPAARDRVRRPAVVLDEVIDEVRSVLHAERPGR